MMTPLFRHVPFDPVATFSLAAMCDEHERAGWALRRIVQWNPREFIAVFERAAEVDPR